MSEPYTPTTDEVRGQYMNAALTEGGPRELRTRAAVGAEFDRWLRATLATVRPNPNDERQVKIVARVLHDQQCDNYCKLGVCGTHEHWMNWKYDARDVLTAQAAMGGEG